ncbi:Histidine--tRNA ligase [bioreactor metagenome]|uniref:Histidine--tRNA ligase n=1 Tax=bioreactor metagenome TaxID=1076179 RepID=A0A645CPE5_9ZZZZ
MALDRKYQPEALALATIARSNGFAAEMDYQGRSMKAQFKAADRTNAKIIALLGEDEVLNSKITLKNTKTKEQITLSYFDLVDQLNKWILADEHDHHEDETEQTECDENDCACHDHQHQH